LAEAKALSRQPVPETEAHLNFIRMFATLHPEVHMSPIISAARLSASLFLVLSGVAACRAAPPTAPADVRLHIQGVVVDRETDLPIPSAQIGLVEPSILGFGGKVWAIVTVRAGGEYVLRTTVTRCSENVLWLRVKAEGYADYDIPSYYDDRRVRCTEDPQTFDFQLRQWSPPTGPG
jgi:hypothetical protein